MNDKPNRSMIIHFTDGSRKVLEFPQQLSDTDTSAILRIKELLEARHLVIEAEGALIVIPVENIKYIQVTPAPKRLPGNAIRGASFKD
jgi:hypothetical protein